MRIITKDIEINIDGSRIGFRLTKLDAFSGVTLLRLLMRLEEQRDGSRSSEQEREDRPCRSARSSTSSHPFPTTSCALL